jgi:hypothetical protein
LSYINKWKLVEAYSTAGANLVPGKKKKLFL